MELTFEQEGKDGRINQINKQCIVLKGDDTVETSGAGCREMGGPGLKWGAGDGLQF